MKALRTGLLQFAAALLVWGGLSLVPQPADARDADAPILVELFTSQGCSSCPPADALLGELAQRPDLVALTLPITYWDYLGWKDTMAAPTNTERQKSYRDALGNRSVYTPQMVIDGTAHVVGSRRKDVEQALKMRAKDAQPTTKMQVRFNGPVLLVDLGHGGPMKAPASVFLMPVVSQHTVSIRRGENGGRVLDYFNVVREVVELGLWDGRDIQVAADLRTLDLPEFDRLAVIVQRAGFGEILASRLVTPSAATGPALSSHR